MVFVTRRAGMLFAVIHQVVLNLANTKQSDGTAPERGWLMRWPLVMASLLALVVDPRPVIAADFAGNYYCTVGSNVVIEGTAVDTTGNAYVAGHFDGITVNIGSANLIRVGAQDAFVAKLDANGNTIWAKSFGGNGASAFGKSVAVDGSGSVFLSGYFRGSLTTPALATIGGNDAFVIKLDSTGSISWAKGFGGSLGVYTYARTLAVDGAGNAYLGGDFQGSSLTTPALTLIGATDAFAVKLNTTGEIVWAKNFGGSNAYVYGQALAVDGAGNVYMGGDFAHGSLTTPPLSPIGFHDAFAIKVDSTGAIVWAKSIGSSTGGVAYGQSIAADDSGNAYLSGYFDGGNLTTPALTALGFGYNAFVTKLDPIGAIAWAKNLGGSVGTSMGNSIALDSTGNIYLSGSFGGTLAAPALTSIGGDIFAIKLDAAGTITWAKSFGGAGAYAYVNAQSIVVDAAHNVYLAGDFASAPLTTPSLPLIGSQDAIMIKLDAEGAISWANGYGSLTPGGRVSISATAMDSAGQAYVTGYFDGVTLAIGNVTLTKIGKEDAFVARIDATGNALWAKNLGGSGAYAAGSSIDVDASGNIYLGGGFWGAGLTTPALALIGNQDAFGLKLDTTGAVMWATGFGGPHAAASGQSIAVDATGNVYLGGTFRDGNLVTPPLTLLGSSDAIAIKLDPFGAIAWATNLGGNGGDAAGRSLAVDATGNVYLGGDFSGNLTTPGLAAIGSHDAFAIKLDPTGAITWAKNFGGSKDGYGAAVYGRSIAVDGSGSVYLSGDFNARGLTTTPSLVPIGVIDAFAIKLDTTGATTWAKNFGGDGAIASAGSIAIDGSANVYLGVSVAYAGLTTPSLALIGNQDAYAIKLDLTGTATWVKSIGGKEATAVGSIAVDGAGNVYFGGAFEYGSLTAPALALIGVQDAFLLKASTGLSVRSIDPASGPASGGTAVTISGSNFAGATRVTIGGKPVIGMTIVNATVITAITPAGAEGANDVEVTTPEGTGIGTGIFTYIEPTLDIDGNGTCDALTDGLLAIRYLFGMTGAPLINGAIGSGALRKTAAQIGSYLGSHRSALDIDGNGRVDALSDGLLILRYLFGLRGNALIAGAFDPRGARPTASAMEAYIASLIQPQIP